MGFRIAGRKFKMKQNLTENNYIKSPNLQNNTLTIEQSKPVDAKQILNIKLLRGKYKNQLTPSSEFARKKIEEILLEG